MTDLDLTELNQCLSAQQQADQRYARLLQRTGYLLRLKNTHQQPAPDTAAAGETCQIYRFPSPALHQR